MKWFASLAATVTCGYLSLATSPDDIPVCQPPRSAAARKALRFEPGQRQLTLRVSVEGTAAQLFFPTVLVLSSPGFTTEPSETPTIPDLGEDLERDAGTTRGTLCGVVTATPSNPLPANGTFVPADSVCVFQATRSDDDASLDTALDTAITARPLPVGCAFPEYSIEIEVVE